MKFHMTARSMTTLGPRTELLVPCNAGPAHGWLRVDEDRNGDRTRAREVCGRCTAERHGVIAYRLGEGNVEAWGPVDGRWHWMIEDGETLILQRDAYKHRRPICVSGEFASTRHAFGDLDPVREFARLRCAYCGALQLGQCLELNAEIDLWERRTFSPAALKRVDVQASPWWPMLRDFVRHETPA